MAIPYQVRGTVSRVAPAHTNVTWDTLKHAGIEALERLYEEPRAIELPRGIFAGFHLGWLDTVGARDPILKPVEELFFHRLAWFVDFERSRWFWFHRSIGLGHFTPSLGPSRWRDTDTVRLLYDDRRLPGFINQWLYDEVKPLSEDVCLGIGGISKRRGLGDQFIFGLRRVVPAELLRLGVVTSP